MKNFSSRRMPRTGAAARLRIAMLAACGMFLLPAAVPHVHASLLPAQSEASGAQSAAPATSANAQAPMTRQAKRQVKRQEEIRQKKIDNPEAEEGENVYRHSATVHALGRFFGLSTEVTARIFEIINFIILVAGIWWIVARLLPKTLRNRAERIQSDLKQARSATEDANRRLASIDERLSRLDREIDAIKTQAEHETVQEEERLRTTMEQEKKLILENAEQEIAAASMNARRELKNLAAELVIEHAKRGIAVTPETDRSLMESFLKETTKSDSRGGVN